MWKRSVNPSERIRVRQQDKETQDSILSYDSTNAHRIQLRRRRDSQRKHLRFSIQGSRSIRRLGFSPFQEIRCSGTFPRTYQIPSSQSDMRYHHIFQRHPSQGFVQESLSLHSHQKGSGNLHSSQQKNGSQTP